MTLKELSGHQERASEEDLKSLEECFRLVKETRRGGCSSRDSLCLICNPFCCQNILSRYYPAVEFYYPTRLADLAERPKKDRSTITHTLVLCRVPNGTLAY